MTVKQDIDLAKAILDVVEADLIQPDGTLVLKSVKEDLVFAGHVEAAFKAAGYAIPADVDKVIAGAVALVTVLGVS